jgi:hypothetical protein
MLEQTVGVIAVTSVSRTTGRFHISYAPGFRSQYAQEGGRVHSARTFFNVVGLCHDAILFSPEFLQFQNNRLKIHFLPPIFCYKNENLRPCNKYVTGTEM